MKKIIIVFICEAVLLKFWKKGRSKNVNEGDQQSKHSNEGA